MYTNEEARLKLASVVEDYGITMMFVAKKTELNYAHLITWKNGHKDYAEESLTKMTAFLQNYK